MNNVNQRTIERLYPEASFAMIKRKNLHIWVRYQEYTQST